MIEITSVTTALLATLAAIFSGICAFLSYKLSKKIRDELKSDERIIVSNFIKPNLAEYDHEKCIIKCDVFNKSKRKVYISNVNVYEKSGELLNVSWSNHIDKNGKILNPCKLIGIVDTEELFIRENQGQEFTYCKIDIHHSFSEIPVTKIFKYIDIEET
jgi:hypothetical protein